MRQIGLGSLLAALGVTLELAGRLLVAPGWVREGDAVGELGAAITATMARALPERMNGD